MFVCLFVCLFVCYMTLYEACFVVDAARCRGLFEVQIRTASLSDTKQQ
jgi:hypothetical protein